VLTEVLSVEGFRVRSAPNGALALGLIEQERPILVLLDRSMPVLGGSGFARALEAQRIALPLCAMSSTPDITAWAGEIGAGYILAKPFELDDLFAIVADAVRVAAGVESVAP